MLRYSLQATYRVEPACPGPELEHVLDLVADDLHPHPVRLGADDAGVTVALDLQPADVRHVYADVAHVLERTVTGLHRHWPRCAGAAATAVTLIESSQRFH